MAKEEPMEFKLTPQGLESRQLQPDGTYKYGFESQDELVMSLLRVLKEGR